MQEYAKNLAETTIKMLGDRWKVQIIEWHQTFWRAQKGVRQHYSKSTNCKSPYARRKWNYNP